MSVASGPVERAMDFSSYLALPEDVRAEYVDGAALVTPPPSYGHQKVCQRLTRLLEDACGGRLDVVAAAGWELRPGAAVRVPDVMVLDEEPAGTRVTATPLVVVEVVSGNRADDLVRKSTEYLEAGVSQYWIVDPRDRCIDVFANESGWQVRARVHDDQPAAAIDLGHGVTVTLDLDRVLG